MSSQLHQQYGQDTRHVIALVKKVEHQRHHGDAPLVSDADNFINFRLPARTLQLFTG